MKQSIDRQMVFDYATYIVLSSYFEQSVCKSKTQKDKLLLQYAECKNKEQCDMESLSEYLLQKNVLPYLPEHIFSEKVEVKLRGKEKSSHTEIEMRGNKFSLRVVTSYRRQDSKIKYLFKDESYLAA